MASMLFSCTADINFYRLDNAYKPYKKADIFFDKQLAFHPTKMLLMLNNLFVISSKNYLYIYKNNKLINKIGGIGFSNNNFSQISDFAIAQNIAVLDGLQRVIKLFDFDGNWIADIKLDDFLHPTLFDVSRSGVYYIYDKDRDEISVSAHPDEDIDFTFGKLELNNPVRLTISKHYLIINNADKTSDIFDLSGQLLEHKNDDIQINEYGSYICNKNFVFQKGVAKPIFSSPNAISFFSVSDSYIITISSNSVSEEDAIDDIFYLNSYISIVAGNRAVAVKLTHE